MGFLDCLGRGGRGVRSVSLWLEDPEEVSDPSGGYLQFSLGQSPDWWWRSPSNHFPQSSPDHHVSRARL